MKSKSIRLTITLLTLGFILFLSINSSQNIRLNAEKNKNNLRYNEDLKSSAFTGKIHIDNNWTAAKSAGICTGNGTYSEPYVIEDLVIDSEGSGSGILIENSDVYFKIENCTVYNSGPSYPNAGIGLSNVNNSLIITNDFSSNYYGIYLLNSNNAIVLENTVNYNTIFGIYLRYSNKAIVSGNIANSNNIDGIFFSSSDYNNISGNIANSNNDDGISLYSSDYNNVSGNIANSNNDDGMVLYRSDYNNVSGNIANSNNDDGIFFFSWNVYNNISGNIANDNNENGIYLRDSHSNTLSNNNASYNKYSGIYVSSSDFNFLLGNTVKSNSLNGIYLRQSRNNIIEGNFIINNDVGIYMEYTLYYFNNFQSTDNEISNNIFNGNNQDIREVTHFIDYPLRSLITSLLILLSIATVGIVITSLTVELITKQSYPRDDEKYHPPLYGISALIVESVGALLFILGAIFLIPIDYVLFWLLILIPFSVVGIIISRMGLKKDAKKFSAGLGIGFGIALLIINSPLILPGLLGILLIAIVPIAVLSVCLQLFRKRN